jgi:hypothetical protein
MYMVVEGDSIVERPYQSDITAKIVSFVEFDKMLDSPNSFDDVDIVLGNIGTSQYEEMYVLRVYASTSINMCPQERSGDFKVLV